jgi:hypothetical protein
MKTITTAELIELLRDTKGAMIVGVESLTDAKATKKDRVTKAPNTFGDIFKKSRSVVMMGANYEASVNRQHEREHGSEGEFIADSLPWGEWFIKNKVIIHKGELYLRTQTTVGQRKVRPAKVQYMDASGSPLTYADVKPFLPVDNGSDKQRAHGVEGEVKVRTFKLSSILSLRIGGETVMISETVQSNAIAAKRMVKMIGKRAALPRKRVGV